MVEKSTEELTLAINNDSLIHIDHFEELYQLVDLADTLNKNLV
jgi:diaminopimelate decarboxylase